MKPSDSARPFTASDEVRESRPFYWIVMIVLAVLYVLAITGSAALHDPARLILFTAVMLLHAALHWFSPRVAGNRRLSFAYLAAQGGLVFVLPLIAQTDFLVLGLSMALIGEAVGLLWDVVKASAAVLVLLALAALDFSLLSPNGSLPSWALTAVAVTVFVVVYVVLYGRQALARARAQALLGELETADGQLREYAARVQELTLASERQRMARELHDTLAQGLAGVILQLEAANTHLTKGNTDRAQSILQQAMTRARVTLADARRAIDDLRAGQDLESALREQVTQFSEATGISCDLDASLGLELPEAVKEVALRMISEGLTNIARHSQASHAWVRVRNADGELIVEVRDDGRGFDPEKTPPGHYGLLGIRERARLACGRFEISSKQGEGTILKLFVPLGAQSQ